MSNKDNQAKNAEQNKSAQIAEQVSKDTSKDSGAKDSKDTKDATSSKDSKDAKDNGQSTGTQREANAKENQDKGLSKPGDAQRAVDPSIPSAESDKAGVGVKSHPDVKTAGAHTPAATKSAEELAKTADKVKKEAEDINRAEGQARLDAATQQAAENTKGQKMDNGEGSPAHFAEIARQVRTGEKEPGAKEDGTQKTFAELHDSSPNERRAEVGLNPLEYAESSKDPADMKPGEVKAGGPGNDGQIGVRVDQSTGQVESTERPYESTPHRSPVRANAPLNVAQPQPPMPSSTGSVAVMGGRLGSEDPGTPAAIALPEKKEEGGITGIESVDKGLKDVPPAYAAPIQRLASYANDMAPRRPISEEAGARHQVALFRSIQQIINRSPDEHFDALFTAVLKFSEAHQDGVFHDTNIYRFMDNIELSKDERTAFQRLMNLIKVLGPSKGRAAAIKQIDFGNSLRYGLTESGRQRILRYFKV